MKLKVNFVDTFTDIAFKGNPAAVIVTEEGLSECLMQLIAAENNLSETAFAVHYDENAYYIRWFSPIREISFSGHATLATAFVLFSENSKVSTLTFTTKAVGDITVKKSDDGYIQMSFPNRKPIRTDYVPIDLVKGLSIQPSEVYLSRRAYFAVYDSEEEVYAVTQDNERLKKLAPYAVVITSIASKYDFISRYFWSANGGAEDPVTGAIHASLAPLWADKLNKNRLSAYQASKRGGELYCVVEGDTVLVSGQAVKYLEGTLCI